MSVFGRPDTMQERDLLPRYRLLNAAISYGPVFFSVQDVRDRGFFKDTRMPVAKDGTIPFARWVIRGS